MTPIAEMVERMLSTGIPPEMIVLAVQTAERHASEVRGTDAVAERRRAFDRDRKRQQRLIEQQANSTGIPPEENQKEIPPTPPKENNIYILPSKDSFEERKKESGIARAREIIGFFGDFWSAYPKRDGANPRKPALKIFETAIKSGHDAKAIIAGAARYASELKASNQIGTPYVAQAATWLRQARWEDYPATAPPAGEPAWKRPPPGCRPIEEIRANAAKATNITSGPNGSRVWSGPRLDENGGDNPEELPLSG